MIKITPTSIYRSTVDIKRPAIFIEDNKSKDRMDFGARGANQVKISIELQRFMPT
jgi:hypothetical protein